MKNVLAKWNSISLVLRILCGLIIGIILGLIIPKVLVKEKPEEGLWMKRVPIPEVGPTDVKIKIHKTAICGTDVHIYQWNDWAQHTIPVGLTAGHEYVAYHKKALCASHFRTDRR